jgi:hypothetical protein
MGSQLKAERHYRLVHFAMFAGHPERALDDLRKAVDGGFFNAPCIRSDPFLAPLRPMPRFEQILGVAEPRHDGVRTRLGADSDRSEILR